MRSLLPALLLLAAPLLAFCAGSEPPDSYVVGTTDGGTPLPGDGGVEPWALKLVSSVLVTNPSPFSDAQAVSSVSSWLRVDLVRQGTALTWDERLCEMSANEVFGTQTVFPEAMQRAIPVRRRSGTLSGTETGARFEAGPFVDVLGATLTDPENEALPTDPDDPRVDDFDGDGEPGMTVVVQQSLLGEGEVYVVQRNRSRLEGHVLAEDRLEGLLVVEDEQVVLDATAGWLQQGTERAPDPDPTHNYFIFQRLGGAASCEEVLLQRETLF